MAYFELRMILVSVLRKFDLALGENVGDWMDQKSWAIYIKGELTCYPKLHTE